MDYQQTIDYLTREVPMFQRIGGTAYKEGLDNTLTLDEHFGHPHRHFHTIHVAGTNGKGSVSHTLAAVLQEAGYKVGLYTSPHMIDFRERIRVNGIPVSQEYVINFVEKERPFFEPLHPSFFELTTAMAFLYFAEQEVDVAVIEVGLGGRLDCTNIISPDLSIITNISFDHTQYLGNTLAKIAAEKAGIIKPHTPVVVGETTPETKPVFLHKAEQEQAAITFAEDEGAPLHISGLDFQLKGDYQQKNARTILTAIPLLTGMGYNISEQHIRTGFAHVCQLTGLTGRWQQLHTHPTLICDTGHNVGGITYIVRQLQAQQCRQLRIVIGMVSDKDISGILQLLPRQAVYYFTQASIQRALPADKLHRQATTAGLHGNYYTSVTEAVNAAMKDSHPDDFIFVGGSSYVVADLLAGMRQTKL